MIKLWQCPKCKEVSQYDLVVGTLTCSNDGSQLIPINARSDSAFVPAPVSVGGKVTVGGNLDNSGKIKVFPNGELNVLKDLINRGDIVISDNEKIKDLLVEVVRTSGSLAELGSNVLKTFFKTN